jgi:hypothetical protein
METYARSIGSALEIITAGFEWMNLNIVLLEDSLLLCGSHAREKSCTNVVYALVYNNKGMFGPDGYEVRRGASVYWGQYSETRGNWSHEKLMDRQKRESVVWVCLCHSVKGLQKDERESAGIMLGKTVLSKLLEIECLNIQIS